jgi:hypothetical protein
VGVTDWVRRAMAELGLEATVKQISDYILLRHPTVLRNQIRLARRKLRQRGAPPEK